jgi:hypothetical protein
MLMLSLAALALSAPPLPALTHWAEDGCLLLLLLLFSLLSERKSVG